MTRMGNNDKKPKKAGSRSARLAAAAEHLGDAGAHFVIESVAELRSVVDRLAAGF